MITGPCRSTQVIIVNSKFLEYAILLLNEDHRVFTSSV